MAKSVAAQIAIQRRLEQARFAKRQLEKEKRKHRNRKISGKQNSERPSRRYARIPTDKTLVDLPVPEVLDLQGHRVETCWLIKEMRDLARDGQSICLDFGKTRSIRPAALILILAQVHKLRLEVGEHRITGTYPTNPRIEQLMTDSGFFDLLRVKTRLHAERRSRSVRYIKFKSDQQIESSEIRKLREEMLGKDLSMPLPVARKIFRALSEAMINVNQHAYVTKQLRFASLVGRWWIAAYLNVRRNVFTVTFYDAGVGIPKTLPRKYTWERIRGALSIIPGITPDDGQMIRAAMELGRSRTEKEHRGKGLLDLAKLIDQVGSGQMTIISRNGAYKYKPTEESNQNSTGFVEGTLIEWELPLDKALEKLPKEMYEAEIDD